MKKMVKLKRVLTGLLLISFLLDIFHDSFFIDFHNQDRYSFADKFDKKDLPEHSSEIHYEFHHTFIKPDIGLNLPSFSEKVIFFYKKPSLKKISLSIFKPPEIF